MANYYRLSFFVKDNNEAFLVMEPNFTSCKSNGISGFISELSFTKKIFAPCEINAVLLLSVPTTYSEIVSVFKQFVKVNLEYVAENSENNATIAENYIIREIKPVFSKAGESTSITLNLKICSPDIKLTDRKYCRTYVKEKLGKILDDAVKYFGDNMLTADHSAMQYLSYTNKKSTQDELRHPYLVQYNEPVYDLIARTANRCGEFLYFENGKLILGLPSMKNGANNKSIVTYDSLSVNEDALNTTADISSSHWHENRFDGLAQDKKPKLPAFPINNEVAYDEYLLSFKKGEYDSVMGEDSTNCHIVADIFSTVLQCKVWYETLADIIINTSMRYAADAKRASDANKEFDKKFFPSKTDTTTVSNMAEVTNMSDVYELDQYDQQDRTKYEKLSQFSTKEENVASIDAKVVNKNIDNRFYDFVFAAESVVANNNIELTLKGSRIQDIRLGDLISITEAGGNVYIVTEVCGSEKQTGKPKLISPKVENENNWNETMTVKAVKRMNGKAVPPPCVKDFVRRGGAQTAYVKDLTDPYRAGRVRLRFPWDSAGNMSPWARVAMASANHNGGGEAYFKPSKDDEVLVEYVGGNMERPCVTGFLHSRDGGLELGGRIYNNVISTPGGQVIRQRDNSDLLNALASISPIVGTLKSMIPGLEKKTENNTIKQLTGYTEITDTYGIYDIVLSSAKRSVTINSPFGKVDINAFTGISISAPNGDISISGKNVKIEAGNNLTLVSGANLKTNTLANTGNWSSDAAIVESIVIKKLLIDQLLAKIIDLKLVRCLIETAIKPVEGTLEIKSNRYMLIEAGEGKAQIPKSAYKAKIIEEKYPRDYNMLGLITAVGKADLWAGEVIDKYTHRYNEFIAAKETYNNYMSGNDPNEIPEQYKLGKIISKGKKTNPELFGNILVEMNLIGFNFTQEMADAADRLTKAVHKIHKKSFIPNIGTVSFQMQAPDKIQSAFYLSAMAVLDNTSKFTFLDTDKFDFNNPPKNSAIGMKKKLYRFLVADMIGRVASDCNLGLPAAYNSTDWTENDNWNKLLKVDGGLKIKEPVKKETFGDLAIKDLKALNPIQRIFDVGVWDETNSKGAMLFSDTKTMTAKFSQDGSFKAIPNIGAADDKENGNDADIHDSLNAKLNVLRNKLKVDDNDENNLFNLVEERSQDRKESHIENSVEDIPKIVNGSNLLNSGGLIENNNKSDNKKEVKNSVSQSLDIFDNDEKLNIPDILKKP